MQYSSIFIPLWQVFLLALIHIIWQRTEYKFIIEKSSVGKKSNGGKPDSYYMENPQIGEKNEKMEEIISVLLRIENVYGY